jgi:phosphate transport system substrate-binding protein
MCVTPHPDPLPRPGCTIAPAGYNETSRKESLLNRIRLLGVAVAAVLVMSVGVANAAAAGLTGAGSTLVAPLMANWISGFEIKEGIPVKYGAVGSGTGIAQIAARTVDFGASDAPLTPEQAAACNSCVQIPWALSATGVGFHIDGVKKLNLTGSILAGIYFGKITNWNDAKIKKINPGAKLPNLAITPVFRSDGSGDTYAFTNYLSKVSKAWKNEVGYATSVGFSHGVGAKGNAGITSTVTSTNGAIGYISASYLIAAGLGAAAIQNEAGNYEFPNLKNIESAASVVKSVPASNALSIVNPPKKATIAYPISTFTYAIVPHNAPQKGFLQQFLNYAVTQGAKYGAALDFAPLPKVVLSAAKSSIGSL